MIDMKGTFDTGHFEFKFNPMVEIDTVVLCTVLSKENDFVKSG
jgi:hypothetical protein